MNDIEIRLERALTAPELLPRDPLFRLEILVRRERAAARRQLLAASGATLTAAIMALLAFIFMSADGGPGRWAVIAAVAGVPTAFLASPYGRAFPTLLGLIRGGRNRVLRAVPRFSLWAD